MRESEPRRYKENKTSFAQRDHPILVTDFAKENHHTIGLRTIVDYLPVHGESTAVLLEQLDFLHFWKCLSSVRLHGGPAQSEGLDKLENPAENGRETPCDD